MSGTRPLLGAVEAGGTKFVCAVGRGPDELLAETRFPTEDPEATLARTVQFLREAAAAHGRLAAVGVGSFGPVRLDPEVPGWGRIADTPKTGWSDADVAGPLRRALEVPVAFDTDVNAAALGEWRWGAGRGADPLVYVTVGTGIGGGGRIDGRLLHGLLHPEMGHLPVRRDPARDPFPGTCPFHGDCLEGLACGSAIAERWGRPAEELSADHPAWELEAEYLAQGALAITLVLSPRRIVLGGGVMEAPGLLDRVRTRFVDAVGGYLRAPELGPGVDAYLVAPGLGRRAGVLGALALAEGAAESGS
jgi:fructokinase